jgi:plasmid rolling circle replication initiator protein Rep
MSGYECAAYADSQQDMKRHLMHDMEEAKLELVELHHICRVSEAKWISNSEYMNDILDLIEEFKIIDEFASGIFRSSEFVGIEK